MLRNNQRVKVLVMLFVALVCSKRVNADFIMSIDIVGPATPVNAGDVVNLDFNITFSSNLASEKVDSVTFSISNATTTTALVNDLTRFAVVSNFWTGGFDANTGVGNFTADAGKEIVTSNSPKAIGRLTLNTTGLSSGTYSLFVQSTDWLVTGDADGATVLYDGSTTAGTGNSITFPPIVSFTIQAVPEPSSLLLVSSLACLGCIVRKRNSSFDRSQSARHMR